MMKEKQKFLLNEKQWQRLQPVLKFRAARQRVMLYLVVAGYSVGELVKMTNVHLDTLSLHPEILTCVDEMRASAAKSKLAFVFPSGDPLTYPFLYRMIRSASLKAFGRSMSQEQLRKQIRDA